MTSPDPRWTTSTLRWIPCPPGCGCGQSHPAYTDDDSCRGRGVVYAADDTQPCPSCKLRLAEQQRTFARPVAP